MHTPLLRGIVMLSLSGFLWCTPLLGQWVVGLEVGADRFWGGSAELTEEQRSFHPYRPTIIAIGVERRLAKIGLGLRVGYMDAALGLEGDGAAVAVGGVFDVVSISPEIGHQLATVGADNQLVLQVGPLIEVWSIIDEETKTRLGLQGSLSFRVPLGSRFAGTLVARTAVSPSPFTREQLDQKYEPRTLWRRGLAGRLEYRL